MRSTLCASCGDRRAPVALQAERLVLCDGCTRAIPAWFFAADAAELDAIFGEPLTKRARTEALLSAAAVESHRDLSAAYEQMGLHGDALLELAVAASHAPDSFDDVARLLERVARGDALPLLARALGRYRSSRSRTAC